MAAADDKHKQLGISGRTAAAFQNNTITPLLAILALLLGFFAIAVTPKEEEPQIEVTFANIFIGVPGASAREVESLISTPAEKVLSEIKGVDDIFSVSRPGMSVLTVAFKVGLPRDQVILDLYNKVYSNSDWLPPGLNVSQPLIKPKGIDDVPIMSLTLWSEDPSVSQRDLTQLAQVLEVELKRISGTRDIYTQGEHLDVVNVILNPVKLNAYNIALDDISNALSSSNTSTTPGDLVVGNKVIQVSAGHFLTQPGEIEKIIVGLSNGSPVYLEDVADVDHSTATPEAQVFHFKQGMDQPVPAVTMAIAKQSGQNAFDITQDIKHRLNQLGNIYIPDNINIDITRNYGDTAKEKSDKLIAKLLFATMAVVVLVLATMGWREAVIVGGAIFITLALTLFASWGWGFTLNRISLFALIFSIGILVDDAIVVVENIHRHLHRGGKKLLEVIPVAVDEVGGPTILATFTVIAALMPMAFVTGLMGPYMSPIPINASTGMLISLLIAFVVTPWLSYKLLNRHVPEGPDSHDEEDVKGSRIYSLFNTIMRPLLVGKTARRNRWYMFIFVVSLIMAAVAMPVAKIVVLKMLPFDNKSEFQVILDMPEGTPMELTLATLDEMGAYLQTVDGVTNYQIYSGINSPINFNGLVRQYYLRNGANQGDIQVNLAHSSERDQKSHVIASSVRPALQQIALQYDASVKIVEVPPGPPVMSPIVAEIYGANYDQQIETAKRLRSVFQQTADIVDIDDSVEADQIHWKVNIDRQRAAVFQVPYHLIVKAIDTLLKGENIGFLHSESQQYATPVQLKLTDGTKAALADVLQIKVRSLTGELIALSELVTIEETVIDKTIYHKNLLPVVFVSADMAGKYDSPLYGLFDISSALKQPDSGISGPGNNVTRQHFIAQPEITQNPSIKWDGEWQITYETFRDMGIAYAVGMILIYLLVVGQFKSYLVPLIIMAPIPLTIIGVMPGHALLGAQFTATSMIGMIALAGIIVRNSILLVDFINQELAAGVTLVEATINSAAVRTRPILLTGFAAMIGAVFILDDPIFSGLAISLIFGILISTIFTLFLIPMLYFVYKKNRISA